MSIAPDVTDRPTLFNPETCIRKGLVEVCKDRAPASHNLYYEIHGAKTDVKERILFIMGLNSSSFSFEEQMPYFSALPNWQVCMFDNRGVGNSDSPLSPRLYTTTSLALDAVELLNAIGWTAPRSLHIVGVSMGGMIAQHLALEIPDRIVSLSLVSTRMVPETPSIRSLKMFASLASPVWMGGPKTAEDAMTLVVETLFPEEYLNAKSKDGRTNREIHVGNFVRRFRKGRLQTSGGRIGQTAAATTHRISPAECEKLTKEIPKIFIITGDTDNLVGPANSKLMHDLLPGSEYLVIPGAGHALVGQITDQFNKKIQQVCEEGRQICSKEGAQ